MPIYEYECRQCGQRFDKMQSFQDAPIRVCPNCGGETRRVVQPVGVIFKGSGWYVNDSRKGSGKSADGDGGGGKAASAEKKTESSAAGAETTGSAAKNDGSAAKSSTASGGD
jgi:putative FmdB family regulatory protein